jgi:DNA-binding transcriptional ArsR family regulator
MSTRAAKVKEGRLREIAPHAARAAAFLKALANEQRLMIVCNLLEAPCTVGELNRKVPLSQSALSQHLAVLREARVVTTVREAQNIHYSLAEGPAADVVAILYRTFCRR